ncbi:MAG: hypothetical protein E7479_00575 [Ruminococcaceae bacterium]|nr:hypothetical protein [Oscillospiraceae bacterium]
MVSKTHAKRRRDIKTKLMAAVAMLLVSSIMMVSTTYAWFTLSTAPEVTGISTSVGANGNLEMALLPTDGLEQGIGAEYGITSGTSDSMSAQAKNLANVTWGNLVDLSEGYGLDQISLYPSALNVAASDEFGNPTSIADIFLKTPSYGADGRVSDLVANTLTSTFVGNEFPQNNLSGVRAVGAASGMTDRQITYRSARSTASNLMVKATSGAENSLKANGSDIANIVVKYAMDSSATFGDEDVNKLLNICYALVGEDGTGGVYKNIEDAYKNYIIGMVASGANTASDTLVNALVEVLEGKDLAGVIDYLTEGLEGYSMKDNEIFNALTDKVDELNESKEKVVDAMEGLEDLLGKGTISWNDISEQMNKIVNTDAMKINGKTAQQIKDNIGGFATEAMSGNVTATIESGAGVYADIADHCGDYDAKVYISVELQGSPIEVPATMKTVSSLPKSYLAAVGDAVAGAGAPQSESDGAQVMPLSEFYGYIIDLAFRTNALTSNLCLQTEPIDRIYDDNYNPETKGGGSSMSFTSASADFTTAQMVKLMGALRVVFFNPTASTDNVLATAKLDMREGRYDVEGETVTADLYLYEKTDGGSVTTYVEATEGATHVADSTVEGGYRLPVGDEVATHVAVVIPQPAGEAFTIPTDTEFASITALQQGVAKAVSVLVYLDGNNITNADVAANTLESMTGTLNLQFASSANLMPMEYGQLIVDESERSEFNVKVNKPEGINFTGNTTANKGENYVFSIELPEGCDDWDDFAGKYKVTMKIGEETETDITEMSAEGEWEIPANNINGDITITVTAKN